MESKSFPRGGRIQSKTNRIPVKPPAVLFKTLTTGNSLKKNVKQRKHKKCRKSVKSKKPREASENSEEHVVLDSLRQDDLEAHMLVLGRVDQLQRNGLLISLPGLLAGFVPMTAISEPYTQLLQSDSKHCHSLAAMFAVGQYVSCMVTGTDLSGHKVKNTLSVSPTDVNGAVCGGSVVAGQILQCAVRSEEEHVFDMDCGVSEARAVLPKQTGDQNNSSLVVGQVVWCLVESVSCCDGVAMLTLSRDAARIRVSQLCANSTATSHTLLPGMQVPVSVTKCVSGGLRVSCLSIKESFVLCNHLSSRLAPLSEYSEGESHCATVLYTLPTLRRMMLSLRHCVADDHTPPDSVQWTAPVCARVIDSSAHGVRLCCPGSSELLFCPAWSVVAPAAGGSWKASMEVSCWPVRHSLMDDLHVVSMKPATLVQPISAYKPGDKVVGTVESVDESGCCVRLGTGGVGRVPEWLRAGRSPRVGAKLKCRVLRVQQSGLMLTCARRLLDGSVSLATASACERGERAWWLVERRVSGGLMLCGWGDAKARLSTQAVSAKFVATCVPGKLLHCEVVDVVTREGRSLVTVQTTEGACLRGQQQLVTTLYRDGDDLAVRMEDGCDAWLPGRHLTDVPEYAEAALAMVKAGSSISVVVLGNCNGRFLVSAKPSFLCRVGGDQWPASADLVEPGMTLACSVIESSEQWVRVLFPCPGMPVFQRVLSGFLGDGWRRGHDLLHRTLIVQVVSVTSPGHYVLSARVLDTRQQASQYLLHCLAELSSLTDSKTSMIGSQVTGEVVKCDDTGDLLVALDDGLSAVVPSALQTEGASYSVGESVRASVVRITAHRVCVLSLRNTVERCLSLPEQRNVRAQVVSEEKGVFLVAVLLPPSPPFVVAVTLRKGFNDVSDTSLSCNNESIWVKVTGLQDGVLLALKCQYTARSRSKNKRDRSLNVSSARSKRQSSWSPGRPSRKQITYTKFPISEY